MSMLSSMNGMLATDNSFKRSALVVTMASKSSVKIDNDQVHLSLKFYFKRLIIACDNFQLQELFQYELYTYPTAPFDSPFTLRHPPRPGSR